MSDNIPEIGDGTFTTPKDLETRAETNAKASTPARRAWDRLIGARTSDEFAKRKEEWQKAAGIVIEEAITRRNGS